MANTKRAQIRFRSPLYRAYHEAGHVVVGLMLNTGQLVRVDIRNNAKTRRGGIALWDYPIGLTAMDLFNSIARSFGGLEAIRLIRKRRPSFDDYLGCSGDWEDAKKALIELGEANLVFQLRHPPDQVAAKVLRRNRVLLEAIATALVEKNEAIGN